jgi:hypothetical protein
VTPFGFATMLVLLFAAGVCVLVGFYVGAVLMAVMAFALSGVKA